MYSNLATELWDTYSIAEWCLQVMHLIQEAAANPQTHQSCVKQISCKIQNTQQNPDLIPNTGITFEFM